MNTFKIIITLLAIVAFVSALPTRNQPNRSYSKLCKLVDDDSEEPIFETEEYRDCLSASDKCDHDEICCPKKTSGGSKCVPLSVIGHYNQKAVFNKIEKPKYSKLCKLVDDDSEEPTFETQEYRDCLNRDKCDHDEICCPKKTSGGSKCVPLSVFGHYNTRKPLPVFDEIKVKKPKYSKLCKLVDDDSEEPIFETEEYIDCLSASDKCESDEICCPKKTSGGSKCVPLSVFGHYNTKKVDTPQYDPRCFLLKDHSKEPIFETEVFRDCLNTDRCGLMEVCCPSLSGTKKGSNTFGGKCVSNQLLNEISKNKKFPQQ